jgi:hypothetical protein
VRWGGDIVEDWCPSVPGVRYSIGDHLSWLCPVAVRRQRPPDAERDATTADLNDRIEGVHGHGFGHGGRYQRPYSPPPAIPRPPQQTMAVQRRRGPRTDAERQQVAEAASRGRRQRAGHRRPRWAGMGRLLEAEITHSATSSYLGVTVEAPVLVESGHPTGAMTLELDLGERERPSVIIGQVVDLLWERYGVSLDAGDARTMEILRMTGFPPNGRLPGREVVERLPRGASISMAIMDESSLLAGVDLRPFTSQPEPPFSQQAMMLARMSGLPLTPSQIVRNITGG